MSTRSFQSPKPINQIKTIELETKCPCGAELNFKVRKPAPFKPEITKAECLCCKSKFLIKTKFGRNRAVDVDFGIQELSDECKAILQETIDDRGKEKIVGAIEGRVDHSVEKPDGPEVA
jgi:hypothetical protein